MNPDLLRIVDANANRAREGLRQVEEHARFVLARTELARRARHLRHELTRRLAAAGLGPAELLPARDTAMDVGRQPAGPDREPADLTVAFGAACGRAQEALRVLEEACPTVAELRYDLYTLERDIHMGGPVAGALARASGVYLIWDIATCRLDPLQVLEAALEAGVEWVQLRAKDCADAETLRLACEARRRTRAHGVMFLVDDRLDIAALAGADGVHLGPGDLPPREARRMLGEEALVGATTHSAEEIVRAARGPIDYMGFGPISRTTTKARALPPLGPEAYAALPEVWKKKAIPIGGIDADGAAALRAAGARMVAVGGAIVAAPDPGAASSEILRVMT